MNQARGVGRAVVALAAAAAGLAPRVALADDAQVDARLLLLVQGDAMLASKPDLAADPQDAPAGPALRLRTVQVGDDVTLGDFRLRVLFEGQASTAAGVPFTPLSGGRLPSVESVRTTETFAAWVPTRAFRLDVGSLRVPFSLSRQVPAGDLRFPEGPPFVAAFLPDFRLGAAAGGDLGELGYRVAVMSASTVLDRDVFDRGVLVAGRLWAEPLGPVGLTPWRRAETDPWYDWFRFAAGLSVLYGTVAAPDTLAVDPDFTAQWRVFVVTAEYIYAARYHGTAVVAGSTQQGAVVEPGLTLLGRRLDVTARADWERAGGADVWGAGAALTAYAPDPRLRLHAGFERRWAQATPTSTGASYWALVRLSVVID
ncbi:MAG TPA: hypothetical protein VKZ18_17670 [Polyangia bacterium]|nr:hypothetical protein [Polyangia bacterium]